MAHDQNEAAFRRDAKRAAKLLELRPQAMLSPFLRLMSRRRIIEREGLRIFVDPTSNLGWMIHRYGTYEELTVNLIREFVKPGSVVLDIGANEGFFAALASKLTGQHGLVIAVEPQSRLQDVLEINLALNNHSPSMVIQGVVAEQDGGEAPIHLYPIHNTGATSLVRRSNFGSKTEMVRMWTPAAIAQHCGVDRFDFVKIDVEGFEPEVMRSFEVLLSAKRVGTILLDYHTAILASRGIAADDTHAMILSHGYEQLRGDPQSEYVVYKAT